MSMELGLRVVRGPDWKWQNQDGGEGHVGTVVEVGKSGNSNTPDKTVVVQWDSGFRTNYRVGYQGFFDLRVFDQAPTGVKHTNICCDSCKQQGIVGTRWRCSQCLELNLCNICYMHDKHDINHGFIRYDTSSSAQPGVKVGKRAKASKVEAKGIFDGAKVIRGPDWDWGNQDGGPGKTGKVLDIRGWDNESGRSVANIRWDTGSTNVYRLGHKGKVDLKYVQESSGGYYYRDHLLKLGDGIEISSAAAATYSFKVGDKVRVDLDVDILKVMQEGHGGWNPKMADCIGKVGSVHRITDRGDIRVQYEGSANRWTFHAGALTKVSHFEVGDTVRIIDNTSQVMELQLGRVEWTDNSSALTTVGHCGSVVQVFADGDLLVKVGEQTLRFNPKCCVAQQTDCQQDDANNTLVSSNDQTNHTLRAGLDDLLRVLQLPSIDDPEKLVRAAAQGHVDIVRDIVRKHPNTVDMKSSGKTALQVASHQGNVDIVRLLLTSGADLQLQDEDGDTALHYSAFGNQADVMDLLLQYGAPVNALNNSRCSALHIAVNKQHVRCVQQLLLHNCDINVQDSYGDTGLHDAVSKDNPELIDLLINAPNVDLLLKNTRGFNVLHHAALKGNTHATKKILLKARQLVDVKKDDGFAALHLAALNGHLSTVEILISVGQANTEVTNNRKQTPLLLAISQGHTPLIELLVQKDANVQAADEEGESCLHLAFARQTIPVGLDRTSQILEIYSELEREIDAPANLSIACFLLRNGANIDAQNQRGMTPVTHIHDVHILDVIRRYRSERSNGAAAATFLCNGNGVNGTECIVCSDASPEVVFRPCGHCIVCVPCSVRMKKCIQCRAVIHGKFGPGGSEISKHLLESMEAAQLMELRYKMEQLEESRICSICLENAWNVAFLCGHSACSKCAEALKQCHMCRKPIQSKINLFT